MGAKLFLCFPSIWQFEIPRVISCVSFSLITPDVTAKKEIDVGEFTARNPGCMCATQCLYFFSFRSLTRMLF